jgi:hypothetical protein
MHPNSNYSFQILVVALGLVCSQVTQARSIECLSTTYTETELDTLKAGFADLLTACGTKAQLNDKWALMEPAVVNRNETQFSNFLKNFFRGCYNADTPVVLSEPLARRLVGRPLQLDADNNFERKLQRGIAAAITDKLINEINAAGGVVALGQLMEGTPPIPAVPPNQPFVPAVHANCAKRDEMVRVLEVHDTISSESTLLSAAIIDEVYSRLKTLIDEQGGALQVFGIAPTTQDYPWLGIFQGTIWRSMRLVKRNHPSGDQLASWAARDQYVNDIRMYGMYFQRHINVLYDYGLLVLDGSTFAEEDYRVSPVYGGTHELGWQGLQGRAIEKLLDLIPPHLASSVFTVSEKMGIGNACHLDSTGKCLIDAGESNETQVAYLKYSVDALPGICDGTGTPCARDKDCAATHQWGPSNGDQSSCPLPQKACSYAPYTYNPNAVRSIEEGDTPDRCTLALGLNVHHYDAADKTGQAITEFAGIFPSDTPAAPSRPDTYSQFCSTVQHEINHAIDKYWIESPANSPLGLKTRRDELINRACTDVKQYLAPIGFCGDTCNGVVQSPPCKNPPQEFVATTMQRYLMDTQSMLNLAQSRWQGAVRKAEPINQFLFFAGLYATTAPVTSVKTIPFYYQNRFTDSGYQYPVTDTRRYGVCQYQRANAAVTFDTNNRIKTITAPDGRVHTFGYASGSTSPNVTSWTSNPAYP